MLKWQNCTLGIVWRNSYVKRITSAMYPKNIWQSLPYDTDLSKVPGLQFKFARRVVWCTQDSSVTLILKQYKYNHVITGYHIEHEAQPSLTLDDDETHTTCEQTLKIKWQLNKPTWPIRTLTKQHHNTKTIILSTTTENKVNANVN